MAKGARRAGCLIVVLAVVIVVVFQVKNFLENRDDILSDPDYRISHVVYPLGYEDAIADSAARHQVNPYWVCAVIRAESNWDAEAVSSAGAIGLMQVQPETAQDLADWGLVDAEVFPPGDLTNPAVNIEYGTAYLRYLVERYHEMEPAICAYNAGPGNVDEWLAEDDDIRNSVAFAETDMYLLRVESYKDAYERMYPDAFA